MAKLLRMWRERALLTQEQLAERAGLNVRTIRRLESGAGGQRPQGNSLRQLADGLGLRPEERSLLVATAIGSSPPEDAALASGTGVPRELPAPPPGFTGRAVELAELEGIGDMSTVVIAAIDGMAGVGKTALAVQAAHRLAGHYPDGQLFVDLHGYTEGVRPVEPGEALDRILRALGVPGEQIPRHLEDRAAFYRGRLADQKMMIVLDNAAGEDQVVPLLPGTPGCLVLVTSRRRLVGLDHSYTLSLDVLPRQDAVTLFTHAAGEDRVRGEASELLERAVELCGRLPLAIRVAAARLRSRDSWTVADLVERLRDLQQRLAELGAGQRGGVATLDLSYQQLGGDERRTYRLLGLHPGATIAADAAAALIGAPQGDAGRLVDRLLEAHLLQEPALGRFRFHDLIRAHAAGAAVRDEPEPARRAALTRLLDHYCHTASAAVEVLYPHARDRPPRLPAADPAVPVSPVRDPAQASGWLDTELPNLVAAAHYAAEHGWPEHAVHLSATLARYLRIHARYSDGEDLHTRALAIARSTGDGSAAHAALAALGHTRWLQGRQEQAELDLTEALALAQATGHRADQLNVLISLGHVHQAQGRHEQAIAEYEQALDIARTTEDPNGELGALNGLGFLQWLQGRHDQATESFTSALALARATANRNGELNALNGLGWFHRQRRQYEHAMHCFEQALDLSRAVGHRHAELSAMIGLGWVHRMRGRHHDAVVRFQQVLDVARKIGNPNWQFEALNGLGRMHKIGDRPAEALDCFRQALDLANGLGQVGDAARAHDGLAHAYLAMDQVDRAREHWTRALDILTSLGIDEAEDEEVTVAAIRTHLANIGGQQQAEQRSD